MKSFKKSSKALLPLVIALVVVGVVFGIIFVKSQETQQTKSKASYDGQAQCQSWCSQITSKWKGTCATRCPTLTAKGSTMTCDQFCDGYIMTNICKRKCASFVNPCTTDAFKGVCANAQDKTSECLTACGSVYKGTKTCTQAFKENDALAKSFLVTQMFTRCKNAFE